jgi:hypothetical protein
MTFTFELSANSPTSVTSNPPSQEHEWIADGIDEHSIVHSAALLYTPTAIATAQGTLYRQDVRLAKQGHSLYYVRVPYGPRDRAKWTWDADLQGGTFNIKVSRQHLGSYTAAGENLTNHNGVIGRQIDGTVGGVDIVIPTMKWNVSITQPYGVVTPAYARFVRSLVGKVNSAPIFGFQAGEVLLLGGRMSDGSECEAVVNFSFAIEENLQNLLVGGISVAQKDGHDYAWVQFKNLPVDGLPATKPVQVDVCRVYERIDLAAALGFGR